MSNLRLYWWNVLPNFGDSLNRDVVAWVAGRPVEWSPLSKCDLIAIGSIYPWFRNGYRRRLRRTHVWGSGSLSFLDNMAPDSRLNIAAVRGPLTAAMVRKIDAPLGDPGLLVDRIWPDADRITAEKPALVLHYSDYEGLSEEKLARLADRFEIVDVRSDDAQAVVRQIARCPRVYSSSLHGLVIADAFRRPNWLVSPPGAAQNGMWKYFDYGLAVERRSPRFPVSIDTLAQGGEPQEIDGDFSYFDGIEALKDGLAGAFPEELRG